MAKYYASAALTGTGTVGVANNPAQPYDVQKLLAASGTPNYGQTDAVCLKTDGTYALTAPLRLPDYSYLPLVAPVDPATNQLSAARAVIDGAAIAAGNPILSCPGAYYLSLVGLHLKNGPQYGLFMNNAFTSIVLGCDLEACAQGGIMTDGGYNNRVVVAAYCRAWNNGGHGIYLNNGAQMATISSVAYRCSAWGNTAWQIYVGGQGSLMLECVGDLPTSGTPSGMGSYGSYAAMALDCTMDGTGTNNLLGIIATSQNHMSHLMHCLAANFGGASALPMWMGSGGTYGGNVASPLAASTFHATAVGSPPAVVNPQFANPASDLTPTVDLKAYARFPKIAQEANWIAPGAIPSAPPVAPAGGGISRARILGGV